MNAQILNTLPMTISSLYPSVYGGIFDNGSTHFTIVETVHDPTLEAEARTAYLIGPLLSFKVAPRSLVCLRAIQSQVSGTLAVKQAGITWSGVGLQEQNNQVNISVQACTRSGIIAADSWYQKRWGDAVSVTTCQAAMSW
jgi:hypothetical protein